MPTLASGSVAAAVRALDGIPHHAVRYRIRDSCQSPNPSICAVLGLDSGIWLRSSTHLVEWGRFQFAGILCRPHHVERSMRRS
jgi:hypothetical protein